MLSAIAEQKLNYTSYKYKEHVSERRIYQKNGNRELKLYVGHSLTLCRKAPYGGSCCLA